MTQEEKANIFMATRLNFKQNKNIYPANKTKTSRL